MNKDIYRYIASCLEEKDLLYFSNINQTSRKYLNSDFWKNMIIKKYKQQNINKYNEEWKFFYFFLYKILNSSSHVITIKKIIDEDRNEILELFYKKHDYHPCSLLYSWSQGNYSSSTFYPIFYSIEKDSSNCFDFFKKCIFNKSTIIDHHSHKILSKIDSLDIYEILKIVKNDCIQCYEAFRHKINGKNVIEQLFFDIETVKKIIKDGSEVFSHIVRKVDNHIIKEYRDRALISNRFDIIKCLVKYRLPFQL